MPFHQGHRGDRASRQKISAKEQAQKRAGTRKFLQCRHARKNDKAVNRISESIREFDFAVPILTAASASPVVRFVGVLQAASRAGSLQYSTQD